MRKEPFRLIRPLNCLMSAFGVLVAILVEVGLNVQPQYYLAVAAGALAAFIFTGAGNALNDYVDRETDRINHPERSLPSGRMRPVLALMLSGLLFAAGILLASFTGTLAFGIALLNAAALIAYEIDLKRRGVIGNLTISYLVASVFLFGGAIIQQMQATAILAILAFLATFGREIIKSVEDMEGDTDRNTLPKMVGKEKANLAAAVSLLAAVGLSPLPYLAGVFRSPAYLIIVAFADLIFIYCILLLFNHPKQAAKRTKLAMLAALMAFAIGGLL